MTLVFVSSRNRGTEQEREQENRPRTVQISVPSELVMDLLAQGAILQVQIGPVPLRPDLARPAPRPERPESTNTRPDASNTRPNVAAEDPRSNPSGRSETGLTRPERPLSRHPPARPMSPYTDWSSLSDNDVISVHSDGSDANYVPRSPVYEPDSPGPVQERENWISTNDEEAQEEQQSRTVVSNIFALEIEPVIGMPLTLMRDQGLPLAEEYSYRGFPLSLGELDKEEGIILAR